MKRRSAATLLTRGPSFPALPYDLSVEVIEETKIRKQIHSKLLNDNQNVFKRVVTPNSPSVMLRHELVVKDMLAGLHVLKDPKDIALDKKKFTYSRRSNQTKKEQTLLDDWNFKNLKPLEDFVRPEDINSPRNTGYNSGHIRSILKLDVFGPTSSMVAARERETGRILSPTHTDRYALLSPSYKLSLSNSPQSSRATSAQSSISGHSSNMKSTDDHMRQSKFMASSSISTTTADITELRDKVMSKKMLKFTPKLNNQSAPTIKVEDRLVLDPFIRRTEWFKSYTNRKKNQSLFKSQRLEKIKTIKNEVDLAIEERKRIKDFERHLTLAKFQP